MGTLGDVISVRSYNPPDHLKTVYACIRSDLVQQGRIAFAVWTDRGSGASESGSMWAVDPLTYGVTGVVRVQSGYSTPDSVFAQCLKASVC